MGGFSVVRGYSINETPMKDFPQELKLCRVYPESIGGSNFSIKHTDDGMNRQLGTLVFRDPYTYVLTGSGVAWINEKFLDSQCVWIISSKDGEQFAGWTWETEGKQILIENGREVFVFPKRFMCESLWFEPAADGSETASAIWTAEDTSGFWEAIKNFFRWDKIQPRNQYLDGTLHPLKPNQLCFQKTFYDLENRVPLFQIRTDENGRQFVGGPAEERQFSERWEAVTAVGIGKNTSYLIGCLSDDKAQLFEYRRSSRTLLKQFSKGMLIKTVDYCPNSSIPFAVSESPDGMRLHIFTESEEKSVGPFDQIFSDVQVSADGKHFLCCALEEVNGKDKRVLLIHDGKVCRKANHIYDFLLSRDGTSWTAWMSDGNKEFLECNGKLIVSAPEIQYFLKSSDGFQYLAVIQDRGKLRVVRNGSELIFHNAVICGVLRENLEVLYTVANEEKMSVPTFYLHCENGWQFGPYTAINPLIYASDYRQWATIVQVPENRKFKLLINGTEQETLYDNIVYTLAYTPLDQWFTYALRDGKWYKITVYFGKGGDNETKAEK